MYGTLIDVRTLQRHLGDADWRIVDCRFDLANPEAGRAAYREAHIPGAVYAHLDEDLAGPPASDHGRHPLPAPEALRARFARLGISSRTQVVAYDDADASMAARLWWLLRYMGHEAVAVLDGGWRAWRAAGHPAAAGEERAPAAVFRGAPRREWVVTLAQVPDARLLVDTRDPARYRGEVEPIDPVAGHIPGAVNYFFRENVDEAGRFLAPAELRRRAAERLGDCSPADAVFYCGSGVTACQNLLALAHAGLPPGRLYPGSWSEWCRSAERAVAKGAQPGPHLERA